MPMKSVYIPWGIALKEQGRPLEDLRRWTSANTVTLSCGYGSRVLLPSSKGFRRPVRTAGKAGFKPFADFISLARRSGFKVSGGVGPLPVPLGRGRVACVDFTGRSLQGRFESWGCPNNPEVIAYGEALVAGIVTMWPELDYLMLDHLEYPCNLFSSYPRIELRDLFVCFCGSCVKRAEREGLDMAGMRREVASLYGLISSPRAKNQRLPELSPADVLTFFAGRPYIATWLNFRMRSMTEYVRSTGSSCKGCLGKVETGTCDRILVPSPHLLQHGRDRL